MGVGFCFAGTVRPLTGSFGKNCWSFAATGLPGPSINSRATRVLDGESIGDMFHAFDVLELDGRDIRAWTYRERLVGLMNLLHGVQQRAMRFADTAYTADQKSRLPASLKASGKEGIVLKRLDAPYTPGRPYSGGAQLKHKFYATLSRLGREDQSATQRGNTLDRQGRLAGRGERHHPANHRIPAVGQVVEVRLPVCVPDSGIVYQAVYLGERSERGAD
jgi:bifunctional non-homologous end joining protein LigD